MKFRHFFTRTHTEPSMRQYEADGVILRVDFFEHILRVALLHPDTPLLPTWSICPNADECPAKGRDKLSTEGFTLVKPSVTETENTDSFTMDGVSFSIELLNFRITARKENRILYRDRDGLAYNFAGELGDGSVHYTRRSEQQRIYGLGDKCGNVNKAGRSFALGATDSMGFRAESSDPLYKQIPFYICENEAGAYGLYYDTYSNGRVNFGEEHDNYFEPFNSIRFSERNMVFYLILGTPQEIVSRFSALCGPIASVPEWAFRYCGSTMEYTDAPDTDSKLRGFIERCRANGIHAGGFYLSSGYTQIGDKRCVFHWNTDKIPSPEGLSRHFSEHDMHLIPNVKPALLTDHPLYAELAKAGLFLLDAEGRPARFPFWGGMASYLDFTNPRAYAFWKEQIRSVLVEKGYCDIWNDNNEYDVWDGEVFADMFGKPTRACDIRPLFSYLMARASREACIEAGVKEPFNVSRCAIAGTQRVASTWTGDNLTDFRDLRFNHKQAMTMALTGFCFFGPDIGGFAGPKPGEELFLRWLQYGVFLPRFVLHSWKPGEEATMPWLYPNRMSVARRLFDLREKMIPYLYAQTEKCRITHMPLLRPVFLRQPDYDPESDCFLCGDRVLACPVFDEGASSAAAVLPRSDKGWFLRGEGKPLAGGTSVVVSCLPEELPVWFVEGDEKPW